MTPETQRDGSAPSPMNCNSTPPGRPPSAPRRSAQDGANAGGGETATGRLRILATTDLHMHLLPYDYFNDRPAPGLGLLALSRRIAQARADGVATLLVDNGDSLHGNPMGDHVAEIQSRRRGGVHPLISTMNRLGFDAATLGNHDFNRGTGFALAATAAAQFPVVLSNVVWRGLQPAPLRSWAIIERRVSDDDALPPLRIGILGFLPPQTAVWNTALARDLSIEAIPDAARRVLPALRAAGADIVVALCHSGIGPARGPASAENAATALACVEGIDAVVAGHTHLVFPGPGVTADPHVDPVRGTLAGKPAVMAGFWGSHLGVIELELALSSRAHPAPDGTGTVSAPPVWQIRASSSRVIAARSAKVTVPGPDGTVAATAPETDETAPLSDRPPVPEPAPALSSAACPAAPPLAMAVHDATLSYFRRRVGRTPARIVNWFSFLGHDPALRLLAMAQRHHLRQFLRGPAAEWPVLSAVAPFRAGGRGGPQHFVDIPAGPITRRDIWSLYPYANRLTAVVIRGAELRGWLERAGSAYRQQAPGAPAMLLDPDYPSYNFDLPLGVAWRWDLSQPALFAPCGQPTGAGGTGRVTDLRLHGRAIQDDARFVLGMNSYRHSAIGPFAALVAHLPPIFESRQLCRDILRNYVARRRHLSIDPAPLFRLSAASGSRAFLDTAPAAGSAPMPSLPGQDLMLGGYTADGFARIEITF